MNNSGDALAVVPAREIREAAARAGFSLCGIAPSRNLSEQTSRLERWLADGRHGNLGYMERNRDKRADPSGLFPGTRSVVVCAVNYRKTAWDAPCDGRPKIASYAFSRDYHTSVKYMLGQMLGELQDKYPGIKGRAVTDSAPIFEKAWAVEAGLGWIGKNSLLITRGYGSSLLLGELLLNCRVDPYDRPYVGEGCGNCRRCMESCPNGAILTDRTIDTTRCISRLTVEPEAVRKHAALSGWVFGCDECQKCCPHNRGKPYCENPLFEPVIDPITVDRGFWRSVSREEFSRLFEATVMERPGLDAVFEKIKAVVKE